MPFTDFSCPHCNTPNVLRLHFSTFGHWCPKLTPTDSAEASSFVKGEGKEWFTFVSSLPVVKPQEEKAGG